ncbi:MAG: bifunctional folylpolyglutamate synthase/dihydrofolate synthase [Candidatus Methanomethylophilus sp.]|nr:bifunctional folylpolyglutamate synthase/dihydrofolate synthase [Methanomethylophilus sp.]
MTADMNGESERREKTLKWLYGLQMHGIKLGLTNIKELLRRMHDPQKNYPIVHVAGSDGKGSSSAIIAAVLRKSGYRVGLYTSPHLLNFNERIAVDGQFIADDEVADFAAALRPHIDDMAESGLSCTFFEVITAMALCYFREKHVQYAVLEVGMGGRFDATNVVTPAVSVINNISMEHTEYLGDTIEKIAIEKAGIIKPGVPCVTINPEPAYGIIAAVAAERGAPLTRVQASDITVKQNTAAGPVFDYGGEEYRVAIPGRNEAKNAALAITALRQLPEYADRIAPHVHEGLAAVRWPCRLERQPGTEVIVDVTHTKAGSDGLVTDVREIYGKVVLVFGVLKDKDVEGLCRNLAAIASGVVVTQPVTERAKPAAETAAVMRKYFPAVETAPTVAAALARAVELKEPGEMILVTGSFYTAEGALRCLGRTSY